MIYNEKTEISRMTTNYTKPLAKSLNWMAR